MRTIRDLSLACLVILTGSLFFSSGVLAQGAAKPAAIIETGCDVSFDYTLTDESGAVIDSSKGKQPMHYVHGQGQIIPGLEKELAGMAVGAEKKVTVKPEEGYGPVDPRAFREVPKDKLPADALKVGTMLMAQGAGGKGVPVRVHEIKEQTVIMDFNHPLAGKTLLFDIKVTEIKAAAK
ncbi:MAG TPA: peptidylprolyl isomerase [Candidatus Binatia bacterium]|nr:peptidylprolyl isomerase [Candidatus Binatia bacterium]